MSSTAVTHREALASRCVAAGGAGAALLHVPLAVAHAAVSLPLAGALLVMALVCLPCAGHLWRTPSRRTWALVAGVGAAMLTAHAALVLAPGATTAPLALTGHAGHATALAGPAGLVHSPLAPVVLSALSLAQVVACLVLLARPVRGQPAKSLVTRPSVSTTP